ncbi:RNA-binding protein [Firmicutes bacterium OM07-11]|nr:RNA-binding protein [Firmicutes bacterium OM07-11]
MQKEEQLLEKHFIDLSRQAYHRNIITYSDFLNLNEQNILHSIPKDRLYTGVIVFGGYDFAERQMAAFIPDALSLRDIKDLDIFRSEISVLHISPLNKKYSEALSHRDYLGAILNLGIERGMIGDILITDSEAIVFVRMQMQEFLTENITRIRHTSVLATIDELTDFHYSPRYEEIKGTVASVRLDSLLSVAFSSSRSKLSGLIEGGKVFVNGRLITSNAYQVKEHDIISVRGMGKFEFIETLAFTKKKRIYVLIHKYV